MNSTLCPDKKSLQILLAGGLWLLSWPLNNIVKEPGASPSTSRSESRFSSQSSQESAANPIVQRLELKKPMQRELKGGVTDRYGIKLKKGQFLRVVAEQAGIDVVLELSDPAGKVLVTADSPNGAWGPEPASIVAAASGVFQAQVKALDKNAATGKYTITITDLRKPKTEDATRLAAESALFMAAQLGVQKGGESQQKAIELYEKASSLWHAVHDSYEEGLALYSIGNTRRAIGGNENYRQAIEYFGRALPLMREAGGQRGEVVILTNIGNCYSGMGEERKAIEYFNQALLAARASGDRNDEPEILNDIGTVYFDLGEKRKALEYYDQVLPIVRALGNRIDEASILTNIGVIYSELGEKRKALEYFEQALPIRRAMQDRGGEALTLNNIGIAYFDLGEKRKALEYYGQALSLEREMGERSGEAATLNNIGHVYDDLGEKQKALDYYNQSLPLRRTVRDPKGEAVTLNNIGSIYDDLAEKQKALDYYNQALTLERAVGDRVSEAITLNNIGRIYYNLGQSRLALEFYNQALPLEQATEDRAHQAMTLNNIGTIHSNLGEKQKALEYYGQALELERAVEDVLLQARTLTNIGGAYFSSGEARKALEYYDQALLLERKAEDRNGEAATLNNIGRAQTALGEKEKALESYNEALVLFRAVRNPLWEGITLDSLMSYWLKEKSPGLAIFFGKQSVNSFQQVRRNIQGLNADLQKSFVASRAEVYRDLGDLLIAQGRLMEAQQVLDLLKEQEYFEFVRGGERSVAARSLPVSLNPEEQSSHDAYEKIAGQITAVGAEFSELRAKRTRTTEEEARMGELKEKLTVANEEMGRFFKTLYVEFGKNTQANQSAENVREQASGMQSIVRELGPGTVALYTLVGETRYSVIAITGSTMQAREYPIAATDLRKKVAAFLEALKNPASDPLPASQELYKILIGPIVNDLKGARAQTLMWSLNDVLRYVPMAALHDGKQYLVESYRNVVITPASIGHLKDKVDVSDSSIAGMGVSKDYDGLGPLPAVPEELKHIMRDEKLRGAGGGLPGTLMLDDDFTEAQMASALDKHYPVVHIASHFVLQAGNETNSYLLLGGKDVGGKGYHLTLAELRDDPALTFDGTELLTLSACQTGTSGTALNGREVDGLGITAQQKGAKAVLASLWSVADESTALLMADFYKQWLGTSGTTKVSALRQAQLDMLHGVSTASNPGAATASSTKNGAENNGTPSYTHPFYWAPFILIGNWK